jgi:hypothetical protein
MQKVLAVMAISLMLGVLALPPAATGMTRYAGTVRAIDSTTGSLVLDDVGPWVGTRESPITPRMIVLSSATEYRAVDRAGARGAPSGYADDYVETTARPSDVREGAFVSVECERDGEHCMAVKLTVVRPAQP